ncbi:hypothetical protein DFH09DRAFT_1188431, partial [Mycena vulgaris]
MPIRRPRVTIIRQEFYDSIVTILAWVRAKREHIDNDSAARQYTDLSGPHSATDTSPQAEAGSYMDIDESLDEPILRPGVTIHIKLEARPSSGNHAWAIPYIASEAISKQMNFVNPFIPNGQPFRVIGLGGLIVTGLPGIGKTTFLHVIFNLRAAANLTTFYMDRPAHGMLWKDNHLYQIDLLPHAANLADYIADPTAWCLVDSNSELEDVPEEIWSMELFTIQASSSRTRRTQWKSKFIGVHYFLMREWGPIELVEGLSFQSRNGSPPQDILAFHERYGGSAHDAYNYCWRIHEFDGMVDTAKRHLTQVDIRKAIAADPSSIDLPEHVKHYFLSAFPLSDLDRSLFQIRPPTEHLMNIVLEKLDADVKLARRRFYQICLGLKTPGCQALAAGLLDVHFHEWILMGGRWPLTKMQQEGVTNPEQKSASWLVTSEPPRFLEADGHIRILDVNPWTSVFHPVSSRLIDAKEMELMADTKKTLEIGIYYRPAASDFLTFNAFYVVEPGVAIAFQASISEHGHNTNEAGVKLLRGLGINKIIYVLVTPSSTQKARV